MLHFLWLFDLILRLEEVGQLRNHLLFLFLGAIVPEVDRNQLRLAVDVVLYKVVIFQHIMLPDKLFEVAIVEFSYRPVHQ